MRHGKTINHLGRTASHRKAMLSNMASSLIINKRISTTLAKAKALRKYVEPLITKAKDNTTNSRRTVFAYLQDKHTVTELFDEVAAKVANRPGGYTRILKVGNRLGDNAEMAIIELVDYNEAMLQATEDKKPKTRRSRRSKPKAETEAAPVAAKAEDTVESASEEGADASSDESKEENKD